MPLRKQGTIIRAATALTVAVAITGAGAQPASAGLLSSLFKPTTSTPATVATTPAATTPAATTPVATTPKPTTPVATTPIATTPAATTPAPTAEALAQTVAAAAPAAAPIVSALSTTTVAPADPTAGCVEQPTTKAFAKFGDNADYSPAPGGTFESGSTGWALGKGASIVSGNENSGVVSGSKSLKLAMGALATSPEFCVSEANPYFRYVAKPSFFMSTYQALVLYRDSAGTLTQAQFVSSTDVKLFPGIWGPSAVSPLAVKIPLLRGGKTASVQLVMTSLFGGAQIDSVMVDPYRRG